MPTRLQAILQRWLGMPHAIERAIIRRENDRKIVAETAPAQDAYREQTELLAQQLVELKKMASELGNLKYAVRRAS